MGPEPSRHPVCPSESDPGQGDREGQNVPLGKVPEGAALPCPRYPERERGGGGGQGEGVLFYHIHWEQGIGGQPGVPSQTGLLGLKVYRGAHALSSFTGLLLCARSRPWG